MNFERVKIYDNDVISACYFRTTVKPPYKKVLLQITERCNLHCEHCFVSSTNKGNEMSFKEIENKVIPKLLKSNVVKVTLTGGEPLVHKDIEKILVLLRENNIEVTICTNAVNVTREIIEISKKRGGVHYNVSLDGFSANSHGRFRGNSSQGLFDKIIHNINLLGSEGLLNGVLVTPNIYASISEYVQLVSFAKSTGANYVLFNPLSKFGRGQDSNFIGYQNDKLIQIKLATQDFCDETFEVVYIRFPESGKTIGECPLGRILYIFTNGDIAICPYVAFASKDLISKYKYDEFIINNILRDDCNIDSDLLKYSLPQEKSIPTTCSNVFCKKGCYAAKISNGLSINDCDFELCGKKLS